MLTMLLSIRFPKSKLEKKTIPTQGQYLVDFCWYNEGTERIELAMEVEWNPKAKGVDDDFYKLIHVKSPLKIWISGFPSKRDKSEALEQKVRDLECLLSKVKAIIRNEKFLIILVPDDKPEERDALAYGYEWNRGRLIEIPVPKKRR